MNDLKPPSHHADMVASVIRERLAVAKSRPSMFPRDETMAVAHEFARCIASRDPLFSQAQFLQACGVVS